MREYARVRVGVCLCEGVGACVRVCAPACVWLRARACECAFDFIYSRHQKSI